MNAETETSESVTTSPFEQRSSQILGTLRGYSNGEVSFEQGKQHVCSIVKSLKTCQDFTTEEVGQSLATILLIPEVCAVASPTPFNEQWRQYTAELSTFLSSLDYVELFVTVIRALGNFMIPEKFDEASQTFFNVYIACYGFLNFSDENQRISEAFGKFGGVDLMIKFIKILDSNVYEEDQRINNTHHGQLLVLQNSMGILHNCARCCTTNIYLYRKAGAVEYFESKTSSKYLNIRIDAVLIMAQIADERATERVSPKLDCVLLLVELLRRAVTIDHHCIDVIGEFDGSSSYSAQELVNALCKLAVNDENKLAIQECGGIPILIYMLQDEFSDEEVMETFKLLLHLVFIESVKTDTDIQDMAEIFQLFTIAKLYSMREIATYILWEVQNHDVDFSALPQDPTLVAPPFYLAHPASEDTNSKTGCIVISYQHESGPKALYIRDKLESSGYNVWMGEFPMKERSLEEKVSIINQSSIMLVCITESYKQAPKCRADVSYAKEQGKIIIPLLMDSEYQPDGWIEKLLGTDAKYHRFCTNEDMDRNLQGVMEKLGDNGKTRSGKAMGRKLKLVMKRFRTALDTSKSSRDTFPEACERNPRYWSSQRVQTWLKDNGLEQVALPPDICQGIQLMHMYEHCSKAMHTFTDQLKSDFELDDKTVIKFTTSLCKLFK